MLKKSNKILIHFNASKSKFSNNQQLWGPWPATNSFKTSFKSFWTIKSFYFLLLWQDFVFYVLSHQNFYWFQINNFVSSAIIGESNSTVSTLSYSPKPEDQGKLLSCQAYVEGLSGSIVEDSRRLHILCKWNFKVTDFFLCLFFIFL